MDAVRCPESELVRREDSNRLISTVYSGPTLADIQNALFVTAADASSATDDVCLLRAMGMEREMNKAESKYSLKIKSNGNGVAEDGYKWRKYGQKFIKNSPNPRSYYKCTNPRCGAKKQVERSLEDPETLIITYEGLHLHFSFPHFFSSAHQAHHHSGSPSHKKLKRAEPELEENANASTHQLHNQMNQEKQQLSHQDEQETNNVGRLCDSPTSGTPSPDSGPFSNFGESGPLGLLEDLVPINILKPSSSSSTLSFFDNDLFPFCSPPSPPSLSCSPAYSPLFFDFDTVPDFLLDLLGN